MRHYLIVIIMMLNAVISAQPKEYNKLKKLLDAKEYDKCINSSKKIISKNPRELMPLFYCTKANLELFKTDSNSTNLKNSLKYMWKILRADKKQEHTKLYSELMTEVKTTSKNYAEKLFYANKNKSKIYYDYIAKIYKDTLNQYYEFYPDLKKSNTVSLGLSSVKVTENKIDENGKKQGFWTKKYENGVVAYEVYFKDDKPVGTHKRYHMNGNLMAKLVFDDKGEWSDAELYDKDAVLIAKGKYQNKLRQGLWTLYRDTLIVGKVNYKDGKKNGKSVTYYAFNGQVSEQKLWKNGIEDGIWRQFYPNGKKRLEAKIVNGKRNGAYIKYYDNGMPEIQGGYKNDIMDGKWIYYNRDGKEVDVITYTNGKADKQEEMNKKRAEILKKLDENKGRFVDPAKYINNPQEYFNKVRDKRNN